MKKRFVYLGIIVSSIFLGCSEEFIDQNADTSNLTSIDLAEAAVNNPALIEGTLTGIYGFMITPGGVTGGRHYDFGQKGVDIWTDIATGDMSLSASSYGWYNNTANLVATVDYTREENRIIWQYYFKIINLANNVILTAGGNDAQPEAGSEIGFILGQAKAARAYAYFYLAQIFQRGYDPAQPILPYYDGEVVNPAKVPASEIYDLIISDLTHSVSLLDGFTRTQKNRIDKTVAQGLLAYAYAAMGNYTDAKTNAEAVINAGYPLTTAGQLANPGAGSGFNNVNTASWIWGFDLTEDTGHQLIDWWGQIDYFTYSYAWAGDAKSIDNALYNTMPFNDIRRSQFGNGYAPLQPVGKFFDPGRAPGGQYIITTDLIFMRVDEFYLLSAECSAKLGQDAAAKTRLIELLTDRLGGSLNAGNYVNPLSGQDLIDAIYLQTRLELWGEGKSYLAMNRNQATVTRGTNHVFRAGESFDYDSDELSFQIPQVEIDNNPSITSQN